MPLAEAARDGSLSAEDAIEYGDLHKKYQQSTFGAHFVEVGVDIATAEIRVRRMLSVCAAGRILNPKSARSQVIGAMTMGVGAALMEELVVDKRIGFFVNHDLAGYEVLLHADIPHWRRFFRLSAAICMILLPRTTFWSLHLTFKLHTTTNKA